MGKKEPEITLGNMKLSSPIQRTNRMSIMLWGSSGSGKTTFAATAPGKKLWINFDPDGIAALTERDDVHVLDFAHEPNNCVMKFRKENPLGLRAFLEEHEDIETVVFDGLTTFGDKALQHGIVEAQGTAKGRSATIEDPGYAGYGNKNTWTRLCVMNLLKVTGEMDRHVIFIAHEDKPVTSSEGVVLYISIMLGSSLNEQIPVVLSEIWNLTDTGKKRLLAVRNCRFKKPVKSRMFTTSGSPEFTLEYDAETGEGEGIATWWKKWKKNGGRKLGLPNQD